MIITDVTANVFSFPSFRVSDSAGHSHPGPERPALMAMLRVRT
ncbi:enolase, partial [bacterium]|nr:enolase [bacterium]